MALYTAGVAGPISLSDGRVVTAEHGIFELDVETPHDEGLVDRGVIVEAAQPENAPAESKAPAAPAATTPAPAAGATPKVGE